MWWPMQCSGHMSKDGSPTTKSGQTLALQYGILAGSEWIYLKVWLNTVGYIYFSLFNTTEHNEDIVSPILNTSNMPQDKLKLVGNYSLCLYVWSRRVTVQVSTATSRNRWNYALKLVHIALPIMEIALKNRLLMAYRRARLPNSGHYIHQCSQTKWEKNDVLILSRRFTWDAVTKSLLRCLQGTRYQCVLFDPQLANGTNVDGIVHSGSLISDRYHRSGDIYLGLQRKHMFVTACLRSWTR